MVEILENIFLCGLLFLRLQGGFSFGFGVGFGSGFWVSFFLASGWASKLE